MDDARRTRGSGLLGATAMVSVAKVTLSPDSAHTSTIASSETSIGASPKEIVARRLRFQARTSASTQGSPFYSSLLERAAADVLAGGPVWAVLDGHEGDPGPSALALRLMGSVHRLVLAGEDPVLGAHYESVGGDGNAEAAWPAFRDLCEARPDDLRALVERGVQTNEVGRCAALLPGFLTVAHETRLPLRLLEVGASAGLNLRFDRFYYRAGDHTWGDPHSPVDLGDVYEGTTPPFHVDATILERRGCDLAPIDAMTEDGRLSLLSFVWPDQPHRIAHMRGALDLAREHPVDLVAADAPTWLAAHLATPVNGVATIIYHSIVMQYLTPQGRQAVADVIETAGRGAPADAPIFRLAFEPGMDIAETRLTSWPAGGGPDERLIAQGGFHGRPTRWLAR